MSAEFQEAVCAGRVWLGDRAGDGQNFAAVFKRLEGRDKSAAFFRRFDNERGRGEPGDDPVSLRELMGGRFG